MTPVLLALVAGPPPVDSNPVTIGPGAWLNLAGTIITVFGALFCGVRYVIKKFAALTRTTDGRSVVAVLEANTGVLTTLAARVESVADDVRDVRSHQSGLTDRVGRIESYLFPSENPRKGWFK